MPEVMEIKKYTDFINKLVVNNNLININILKGRYKKHGSFELFDKVKKNIPLKLLSIKNKGKFIYFEFENNYFLLNTLGLSGGWAFLPNNSTIYKVPKLLEYIDGEKIEDYLLRSMDHINVEFVFSNGKLVFFDMLSFGTLKFIDNITELNKKLNSIGPDIMDTNTDFILFKNKITAKSYLDKKIGNVVVNQKVISGVGNYIRADALWLSKINPFRNVQSLSDSELYNLFYSLKIITWGNYNKKKAIELKILKKSDKTPHDYKRDFFIYREDTDIYNNPVVKEELFEGSQKRFIYWVPNIQK